jgi:hypothetical protein
MSAWVATGPDGIPAVCIGRPAAESHEEEGHDEPDGDGDNQHH